MEVQSQSIVNSLMTHRDVYRASSLDRASPVPSQVPHEACLNFIDATVVAVEDVHLNQNGFPPLAINELALAFIKNVNFRFSEHSRETAMIYGTLGRFGRGEIPKRDALSVVVAILDGHHDLKYELMEMLNHRDSQWDPRDFDLSLFNMPQPLLSQTAPPYLQPDHQPKIRLPSMSALSECYQGVTHPANQMVFGVSNYSGDSQKSNIQEHLLAPIEHGSCKAPSHAVCFTPTAPTPTRTAASAGLTSPNVEHTAALTVPSYATRHEFVELSSQGEGNTWQQPPDLESRDVSQYSQDWVETGQSCEHEAPFVSYPYIPVVSYEARDLESPLVHCTEFATSYIQEQDHDQAPSFKVNLSKASVLETPSPKRTTQQVVDMPPPPPLRKRSRKPSAAQTTTEKQRDGSKVEQACCDGQQGAFEAESRVNPYQLNASAHFVHGLCGKGFATRSKVKKHHWGSKLNDLDTTTGCWSKYDKPNVSWDDHPSCKDGSQVLTTKMARMKTKRQSMDPNNEVPAAPAVAAGPDKYLPDALDLERIPCTVAKAPNSPPWLWRYAPKDHLSYHSNQLPRSPFESLLTAVNAASMIEAPVPQEGNDLVVSQLNAQALVAERVGQYVPTWACSSQQYDPNVGHLAHYEHPYAGYGHSFETSPVPFPVSVEASYPHQTYVSTQASSIMSPMEAQAGFNDPSTDAGRVEENFMDQNQHVCAARVWDLRRSSLSPGHETRREYNGQAEMG